MEKQTLNIDDDDDESIADVVARLGDPITG